MYNMGAELIKNMGFQNVQDFLTDPDTLPPTGPSPEEQQAQAEVELKNKELDIKAADVQIKAQKLQLDAQNDQVEARLKSAELNLEAQQDRPVAIGRT
jgi:multidrug resistance efflux pump